MNGRQGEDRRDLFSAKIGTIASQRCLCTFFPRGFNASRMWAGFEWVRLNFLVTFYRVGWGGVVLIIRFRFRLVWFGRK